MESRGGLEALEGWRRLRGGGGEWKRGELRAGYREGGRVMGREGGWGAFLPSPLARLTSTRASPSPLPPSPPYIPHCRLGPHPSPLSLSHCLPPPLPYLHLFIFLLAFFSILPFPSWQEVGLVPLRLRVVQLSSERGRKKSNIWHKKKGGNPEGDI